MAEYIPNCLMVLMGTVYFSEVMAQRLFFYLKPLRVVVQRFSKHDYCACALGSMYILTGVFGH